MMGFSEGTAESGFDVAHFVWILYTLFLFFDV